MGGWSIAPTVRDFLALANAGEQALGFLVFVVVVFLAVAVQFLKIHELSGSGDSAAQDRQTNCPSCGARMSVEADECGYCGEPLPDGASGRRRAD